MGCVKLHILDEQYKRTELKVGYSKNELTQNFYAENPYSVRVYVYCLNNPVRFVDLRGDSVSVSQSITNNNVMNQSFMLFATSKAGKKFLANYASKGQTIAGHTYDKDGKYHKKGINLEYTSHYSENVRDKGKTTKSENGTITVSVNSYSETIENGSLYKWDIDRRMATNEPEGVFSRTITFFHESFIHADLYAKDFSDNRKFDYSNIPMNVKAYIRQYFQNPERHYHHMYVSHFNGSSLWPNVAKKTIIDINASLGFPFAPNRIEKIIWDYDGGR